MGISSKPYGEANVFPAIWPVATWLVAIVTAALFGERPSPTVHSAIVAVGTIFTYGVLVFPIVSYATFKYLILPLLNYLPRVTKNESYLFNSAIILGLSEVLFLLISLWVNGLDKVPLQAATAAIPTSCIGLNCAGHFWFSKLFQEVPNIVES